MNTRPSIKVEDAKIPYPAHLADEIRKVDEFCEAIGNKAALLAKAKAHLYHQEPAKNRVKVPTLADRFTHTMKVGMSTEKYLTIGRTMRPELVDSSIVLQMPTSTVSTVPFAKAEAVRKKYYDSVIDYPPTTDIPTRVHVPAIPLHVTKLDVDPQYFSLVKCQPTREIFCRNKFKAENKRTLFRRVCVDMLHDEVKKKEEQYVIDLYQLFTLRGELEKIMQGFELFLSESLKESVNQLYEAAELSRLNDAKQSELERCKACLTIIKSSIYELEEELAYRKLCKEILHMISPVDWQEEYKKKALQALPKYQKKANIVSGYYKQFCRYCPDPVLDETFDNIAKTFLKTLVEIGPPIMHFNDPNEIETVFAKLDLSCWEQAKYYCTTKTRHEQMEYHVMDLMSDHLQQMSDLDVDMQDLEDEINFRKKRTSELEVKAKETAYGRFKIMVSSDQVLEALALANVLYVDIVQEEIINITPMQMVEAIDRIITDTDIKIRKMSKFYYHKFETIARKCRQKKIKESYTAKGQERYMKGLIHRCKNLLTPALVRRRWRQLVFRSNPPPLLHRVQRSSIKPKQRSISTRKDSQKSDSQ